MPNLDDKFQRLPSYQTWTDSISGNLAYAVDRANITRIQSMLGQTLQNITPRDFRSWIFSDILHPGQILENLHQAMCTLTLFELITAIDGWHQRLLESLRILEEQKERVLCCGPGAVEDRELPADSFIRRFGIDEKIRAAAKMRKPDGSVKDKADVIAFLWQVARQPGQGLKPFLDDPELRNEFEKVFNAFAHISRPELGGAQFHMARANRRIGIETDVTWVYHPQPVAEFVRRAADIASIHRVVVETNNRVGRWPFDNSESDRPHRQSYILKITPAMDVAGVEAIGSDRVIFRMRRYCTNDWDLFETTLKCSKGEIKKPFSWQPQEWPSLPLIGHVHVDRKRNKMEFHAAGEKVLTNLVQEYKYKRIIWNGLATLDDPGFDEKDRQILVDEIVHQFEILSSKGAQIYLEISGVPKYPELIQQIVADKATCVGINQTELVQLTSKSPVLAWPNPSQHSESLLERCHRGIRLAKYMRTDVFIHANECSMYITPSPDQTRLKRIVLAMLVAKLVVVEQLLNRAKLHQPVGQPSLSEKGFMALLQFAHDFARFRDDQRLLDQIMHHGYFCAQNGSDYSVAIAPVPWPEEVQQVDPTGAGDTIAGVVAALLPGLTN